jgi:hypothetical protein
MDFEWSARAWVPPYESEAAYLSRIDPNLGVAKRLVVANDPRPAFRSKTSVGEIYATNSGGFLFPVLWSTQFEGTANSSPVYTAFLGALSSTGQAGMLPAAVPDTYGRLFHGRGGVPWYLDKTTSPDLTLTRLNDDGSVAHRFSAVRVRGWILDAAQGSDGNWWVTQRSANAIGRVTMTP